MFWRWCGSQVGVTSRSGKIEAGHVHRGLRAESRDRTDDSHFLLRTGSSFPELAWPNLIPAAWVVAALCPGAPPNRSPTGLGSASGVDSASRLSPFRSFSCCSLARSDCLSSSRFVTIIIFTVDLNERHMMVEAISSRGVQKTTDAKTPCSCGVGSVIIRLRQSHPRGTGSVAHVRQSSPEMRILASALRPMH